MEGLNAIIPDRNIGDIIVYRNNGIYRIGDIREENFCGIGERMYYVMRSVYDQSAVIYLPIDTKDISSSLRCVLSPDMADEAILGAVNSENTWIEDIKERGEYFDKLFDAGVCSDIVWIYKVLTEYKAELEGARRKLYANDTRVLAAAEKIIMDEFSYALGIDKGEVLAYIDEKIGKKKEDSGEQESL